MSINFSELFFPIGIIIGIILAGFGGFLAFGKKKNSGWIYIIIGPILIFLAFLSKMY